MNPILEFMGTLQHSRFWYFNLRALGHKDQGLLGVCAKSFRFRWFGFRVLEFRAYGLGLIKG